jgi:putative transposase
MSHSYSSNLVHIVFSTKGREKSIPRSKLPQLWPYFGGIAKNHQIPLLIAGGMVDHAHLLFVLPATTALSKTVQVFKANSSRWIAPGFEWQSGYAAFSVSRADRESVHKYIATQEEHHRTRSFEEEFLSLLKTAGIDCDPKFVFG